MSSYTVPSRVRSTCRSHADGTGNRNPEGWENITRSRFGGGPMGTGSSAVPLLPFVLVTVRSTRNVPPVAYTWVTLRPESTAPSPNAHVQDTIGRYGSEEGDPSNVTPSPATGPAGM